MPLNIDWQQILIHIFNTVLLFGILYFLLYKPVKAFMEKRAEYYKNMNSEAEKVKAEAVALKKEYEMRLVAAEEEIRAMKELTEHEISAMQKEGEVNAIAEAEAIISKAKATAEFERKKILHDAESDITEIVTYAAEKIAVSGNTSFNYDEVLKTVLGDEADG